MPRAQPKGPIPGAGDHPADIVATNTRREEGGESLAHLPCLLPVVHACYLLNAGMYTRFEPGAPTTVKFWAVPFGGTFTSRVAGVKVMPWAWAVRR